jgi:hypothetical protein
MGAAEELQAMADSHLLEAVDRDIEKASSMLKSAQRSLKTARDIAAHDPDSALTLAWDRIAFQALGAMLTLAGYRVTSEKGHHRVTVDAGRLLLGEQDLLSRIGALRRSRDRGMYESEPAEKEEVVAALEDCEKLIEVVGKAIDRARTVL